MTFTDRLRAVQLDRNSLLCIALDTDPRKLPPSLVRTPDALWTFNRNLIEATQDLVCSYKLNLAFYEAMGEEGWRLLRRTLAAIPNDIITVADGKRGDIGNSSEMYARSLIDELGFQASTLHPYMGFDSLEPFLRHPDHGVFVLALTSNPGAKDIQYLKVNGRPLYERVVAKARKWNANGNVGIVVGATRPAQLQSLRLQAPTLPFLIPGIGAQGGDLKRAVLGGCDRMGTLALLTVGRSVVYASSDDTYAEAARAAAAALRDEINRYRADAF